MWQAGADDIKKHKWFSNEQHSGGSYWDDMFSKKLTPPIKPEIATENDTTNFECADTAMHARNGRSLV